MPRPDEFPGLIREAVISDDQRYRYSLTRTWDTGRTLNVIGLNPSTADAEVDDMTIGRCMRFAKRLGFGQLVMTNLFAYRATKPAALLSVLDPVGPDNDSHVAARAEVADAVLAAWGANKLAPDRVRELFRHYLSRIPGLDGKLMALKMVAGTAPGHPLYVSSEIKPEPYWPPEIPKDIR